MRRVLLVAALAALLVAPVARAWTWPVDGPVLQPFSFDPAHPYAAGEHRGIDIAAGTGEVVLAPAAGTVTFSGTVPGSGRALTITTADGLAVTLTHLGSLTVAAGTRGRRGTTGRRRRPERRPRGRRAVPPPRRSDRRRGAGISRPALVPARARCRSRCAHARRGAGRARSGRSGRRTCGADRALCSAARGRRAGGSRVRPEPGGGRPRPEPTVGRGRRRSARCYDRRRAQRPLRASGARTRCAGARDAGRASAATGRRAVDPRRSGGPRSAGGCADRELRPPTLSLGRTRASRPRRPSIPAWPRPIRDAMSVLQHAYRHRPLPDRAGTGRSRRASRCWRCSRSVPARSRVRRSSLVSWAVMASGGKKILVAPAWPYASGFRHLGHAAAYVPFDVFARYHRLKGNDVLAVSGTDEHGTPVMVAADAEGKSYREIADFYNQAHREDFRRLGFTYDCFTRTTTPNHARITQDLFETLYEKGAIVERAQLVSFSPATGHTLPDRYIEGTCPICGYPEARGDQCDNCGNQLDPTDLINPRSKIDGSTPEFRETNHLFLDLPAFAETLQGLDRRRATGWRPNVRNFSLGLLDDVRARPITRDLDWGVRIPVPGYAEDPEQADLRLVRRGDRLPVGEHRVGARARRAGRLAGVVAERRRTARVLPGQGQHRLPHGHLAVDPARLRRRRRGRRRQAAPPARRRVRDRVPEHGGEAVLDEPRPLDLPARLPRPLRPGSAALLPDRREPGDAGHRLHVGRLRAPIERRAARQLGQPRQPHADQRAPQLRRRAGAGRSDRRGPGRARRRRRRLRLGRDASRGRSFPRRARARRCGSRRRSTSTSPTRHRGRR